MGDDKQSKIIGDFVLNIFKHIASIIKSSFKGITRLTYIRFLLPGILIVAISYILSNYKMDFIIFVKSFSSGERTSVEQVYIGILGFIATYLPLIALFFYLVYLGNRKKPKRSKKGKDSKKSEMS
ncbi:MAG: hypothetical protein ABF289_03055 [Clostridiales bacterium]